MSTLYAVFNGRGSGVASSLYTINVTTGVASLVGAIGFNDVLSIAYDATTDTLFGVTTEPARKLISINRTTGAGTLVANIAISDTLLATDLMCVNGQLYAWNETNLPTDTLCLIDKVSGVAVNKPTSNLASTRDALAYDPTTGLSWLKAGNSLLALTLSTGAVAASGITLAGGILFEALTFSSTGTAYSLDRSGTNAFLAVIPISARASSTVWNVTGLLDTGVSNALDSLEWVPDAYVDPAVKPIPVATTLAPQTPCTPKSELSNGGRGKFGCNNGGVGWTSSYAGPYGTVPQHEDPVDGETMTGKEHAGIEAWIRLYHVDYPSGVTEMIQRAMVELADPPAYEFGRKTEGLVSIGDIENAIGNEAGGLEATTVDITLSDAIDRAIRIWLSDQDLDGDQLMVLMASDAARQAA